MTTPQQVADRYISPSGRRPDYSRPQFTDDLICAASFLVWAEHDGEYFGGVDATSAFVAMCRLIDVDPVALRKAVKGE